MGNTRRVALAYVTGLSVGNHVVSTTYGASTAVSLMLASLFGIASSSLIDASTTKNATSTSPSSTLITNAANDLIMDVLDTSVMHGTTTGIESSQTFIAQNVSAGSNTATEVIGLHRRPGCIKTVLP